jgi:hypothetical protein
MTKSASLPAAMAPLLVRPAIFAGSEESHLLRLESVAPCCAASDQVAGNVNCSPLIPVKASRKEPARISSVVGVWSEARKSTVPSASARQSMSRLREPRSGGAHLKRVSPRTTPSASNMR